MRFLNVVLGAAAVTSVAAAPTTSSETSVAKRKSKFLFTGVNESGAEFGSGNLPGTLGTDYTWPVHSTIDVRKTSSKQESNILTEPVVDSDRKGLQHLPSANFDVRQLSDSRQRKSGQI